MSSKLQGFIFALLFIFLGLLLGWFFWGKPIKVEEDHDMFSMMIDMTNSLDEKTGDDFDVVFLNEMIVHHQGAVDMANLALKNAKHPEIIKLSKEIVETQNAELGSMKTWLKNWYDL